MFSFAFESLWGVIDTDLTLDLTMTSTTDWRGVPTVNAHPVRNLHIHVGFQLGDANGDGMLTIGDVSTLQDWLLFGFDGVNLYQRDAADMNRDGELTVDDLSILIDLLLDLGAIDQVGEEEI